MENIGLYISSIRYSIEDFIVLDTKIS